MSYCKVTRIRTQFLMTQLQISAIERLDAIATCCGSDALTTLTVTARWILTSIYH